MDCLKNSKNKFDAKFALVVSMLFQLGAAVFAITLIRRTRYNISWILISAGLVLMAIRRLFDFSTLFWETNLFQREEINAWIGVLISVFIFIGVIFIRKIFNLHDQVEKLRQEKEQKILSAIIHKNYRVFQNGRVHLVAKLLTLANCLISMASIFWRLTVIAVPLFHRAVPLQST